MANVSPRDRTENLRPKSSSRRKSDEKQTDLQVDLQSTPSQNADHQANGQNHTPATVPGRRSAPQVSTTLPTIDGYEILSQLGRGGMGVVYKAWHFGLRREVALKMIVSGQWASAEDVERLRLEATAAARLQHPHIVQIYDNGEHDGLPFYSMEYIDGGTLGKILDRKPLPPSLAASLIQDIATGVQYAHDQGIVHRDLKPDNILIANYDIYRSDTKNGKPKSDSAGRNPKLALPKIADFGIAKNLKAGSARTQTGAILGTPSYIAPEQISDSRNVGPAADIYALGAILYEMLTGQPPFSAVESTDVLRMACHEEPTAPRKLQQGVPTDLETICLKCLEKIPAARYASAQALVEDLQRYRQGQPIQAKPSTTIEKIWKWARRYPGASVLSCLLVIGTILSFFLVTTYWQRAETKANQATVATQKEALAKRLERKAKLKALTAQEETNEARLKVEQLLADTTFDLSLSLAEKSHTTAGLLLLNQCLRRVAKLPESPRSSELESAIRRNMASWNNRVASERMLWRDGGWITDAAFSPDGKIAFSVGETGLLRVMDVRFAKPLCEPIQEKLPFWSLAVSPDGKWFATGSGPKDSDAFPLEPSYVTLWTMPTEADPKPRKVYTFKHPTNVHHVAFSYDGTKLLSLCDDDAVRIWEKTTPNGKEQWKTKIAPIFIPDWLTAAVFSPDGTMVLTGSKDNMARLFDAQTGKLLGAPMEHAYPLTDVAFRPDGKLLATATGLFEGLEEKNVTGQIRFWNPETCQPVGEIMNHRGPVKTIAFSPNGRIVASGAIVVEHETKSISGSLQLWNADDKAEAFPLGHPRLLNPIHHPKPVWSIAFSPDSRVIGSGCEDRNVRFFNSVTGESLSKPFMSFGTINNIEFSRCGWLAIHSALSSDGNGHVLNVPKSNVVADLIRTPSTVHRPTYTADGKGLLLGGDFGAYIVDRASRKIIMKLANSETPVHGTAVDPNGKIAATGDFKGVVKLWHLKSGKLIQTLKAKDSSVFAMKFNVPGNRLLVWQRNFNDHDVSLWSVDGRLLKTITRKERDSMLQNCGFAHGGNAFRIAETTNRRLTVTTYDCQTGRKLSQWTGRPRGLIYEFSHDGKWLLECSRKASSRLIDAETGKADKPVMMSRNTIRNAHFSPDGTLLAMIDGVKSLRLWDVATCKPIGAFMQHPSMIDNVRVSPNNDEILVISVENFVYRWSVPKPFRDAPTQIGDWLEYRTSSRYPQQNHIQLLEPGEILNRYQRLLKLNSSSLPVFPLVRPFTQPAPTTRPMAPLPGPPDRRNDPQRNASSRNA